MLKRASLGFVAATASWQTYVRFQRKEPELTPQGNLFWIASTDDQVMDSLRTGDVLLFRRDCFFAAPTAAAVCRCTQLQEKRRGGAAEPRTDGTDQTRYEACR